MAAALANIERSAAGAACNGKKAIDVRFVAKVFGNKSVDALCVFISGRVVTVEVVVLQGLLLIIAHDHFPNFVGCGFREQGDGAVRVGLVFFCKWEISECSGLEGVETGLWQLE